MSYCPGNALDNCFGIAAFMTNATRRIVTAGSSLKGQSVELRDDEPGVAQSMGKKLMC